MKKSFSFVILRTCINLGIFCLLGLLYWSSLLVENDLKEIKRKLSSFKSTPQEEISSPLISNNLPRARPHIDPSLPNLLEEDPFYQKTLPSLLGKDFKPHGMLRNATIGKPDNLHPFGNWTEVNTWQGMCGLSVAKLKIGRYETMSPYMAIKMEARTRKDALEEAYDEGLLQQANHVLRLAHYPPLKPGDDPKGQWSAPNRDKSVLSLSSIGSIPGLQFYSNRGAWEPVIVPANYFIVSTGLLLQHKTAGLIKARWKRVINPGGIYVRMPRTSTVFYGTWTENYSLKPFPKSFSTATSGMSKQHQAEYLKKYPDILVREK